MKESTFITWKDTYSVGIPQIDEQHQELVYLTANLYTACMQGTESGRLYFKQAIHKIVQYVSFHFSAEEKLMERIEFPEFAEHKKQHESFVKKVLEEVKKFEGGKAIVPPIFVRFLRDWILTHIAEEDQKYGDYVRYFKKESVAAEVFISSESAQAGGTGSSFTGSS
ncbi:MAG: bacteriohemerythrin [Treponema sp.]|jgi:hemerythrin|nr:bacteriohemerythrin [Treponema sp.]